MWSEASAGRLWAYRLAVRYIPFNHRTRWRHQKQHKTNRYSGKNQHAAEIFMKSPIPVPGTEALRHFILFYYTLTDSIMSNHITFTNKLTQLSSLNFSSGCCAAMRSNSGSDHSNETCFIRFLIFYMCHVCWSVLSCCYQAFYVFSLHSNALGATILHVIWINHQHV